MKFCQIRRRFMFFVFGTRRAGWLKFERAEKAEPPVIGD